MVNDYQLWQELFTLPHVPQEIPVSLWIAIVVKPAAQAGGCASGHLSTDSAPLTLIWSFSIFLSCRNYPRPYTSLLLYHTQTVSGSKVWIWPTCRTTVCRSTSLDRATLQGNLIVPQNVRNLVSEFQKQVLGNSEIWSKNCQRLTFSGHGETERQKTNSLQCDPKLRLINWGPLNYSVPQTQSR